MANSAEALFKSRLLAKPMASETAACRGPHSTAAPNPSWSYVSIGFITDLPPCTSPEGQRACSVVVFLDRLSRQARFVPAPESPSACEVAALFTNHLQGRSGPPKSLLWDRDPEPLPDDRAREFWSRLCLLLHVPASSLPSVSADAGASSTSTSVSTSHSSLLPMAAAANRRILEQLIRNHVHQLPDTWVTFLPLAEAAYNGAQYSVTAGGATPFIIRYQGQGMLPASAPGSPCGSKEMSLATRATAAAAVATAAAVPSPPLFASANAASQQLQIREIHLRAQQELQAARARYNVVPSKSGSSSPVPSSGSSNSHSLFREIRAMSASGSVGSLRERVISSNGSGSSSSILGNSSSVGGMMRERTYSSVGSSSSNSNNSSSGSSSSSSSSSCSGQVELHSPDPRFSVGDKVRISTTGLCIPDQPTTRLRPGGFLGPFTVVGVVSPAAYRLEFPPSLCRLHPVLHASRLLPWTEHDGESTLPAPPAPPAPAPAAATVEVVRCSELPSQQPIGAVQMQTPLDVSGDSVTGVRVGETGRLQPTVMFHIRWGLPRRDGRRDGWEPYAAVEQLPAVREYLRSSAWRDFKKSDAGQMFMSRWPDRMPRVVRFEV